jgi:hypothetical protein
LLGNTSVPQLLATILNITGFTQSTCRTIILPKLEKFLRINQSQYYVHTFKDFPGYNGALVRGGIIWKVGLRKTQS